LRDINGVLLLLQHSTTDISISSTLPSITQIIVDMDDLDEYKHVVPLLCAIEGVLNRVRDAELRANTNLIALLLISIDHVSGMASQIANGDEIYLGHVKRSHGLIRQLRAYQGNTHKYAPAA
jgi:chemotaxis protein histidine kinase CheA